MLTTTPRLSSLQRAAYEAVRRAAAAPLDSVHLREEISVRAATAIAWDFAAFGTSDPTLGLLAHGMSWGYPDDLLDLFYAEIYPREAAVHFLDMARSGELVSTELGPIEADLMRTWRIGPKLHVVAAEHGRLWGAWCMARHAGAPPFSEEEQALAALLAPVVAAGLRRAALLEAAQSAGEEEDAGAVATAPGVAVYDQRGRLVLRDARAARYLEDLADIGTPVELPAPVAGALAQLRWRLRTPDAAPGAHADAGVRLRGRSRRWYTVHASLAEGCDVTRAGHAVVVLTPLGGGERAGLLAQLYGLTPREREVAARVARGESGKQIAAALGLSEHTVQAHIDNACAKIGVRGRRELVARLFVDARGMRAAS